MRSIKIAGLCLVAMFALSMVVAGSASAEETKPYFGQCQKVKESGTGNAGNSQCSVSSAGGEWVEVVGGETECRETVTKGAGNYEDPGCTKKVAKKNYIKVAEPVETFSSTSGEGFLEATGTLGSLEKLTCKTDSDAGRIIGPKEVRVKVTFKGCAALGGTDQCHSLNPLGAANEIIVNELKGQLGYIKKAAEVGLVLSPVSGTEFVEFECGSIKAKIRGAVIGRFTSALNEYSRSGTLTFEQSKGKQKPEKLEGGVPSTLEISTNGGTSYEQAAEQNTDNLEYQDYTQIIA